MDPNIRVYDDQADEWLQRRSLRFRDRLDNFRNKLDAGPVADLGCGPGWHTPLLPQPAIALDASRSMLAKAQGNLRVVGDLRALPFRRGALRGAWASRSYVHLRRTEIPMALADLHAVLAPNAPVELHLFAGDMEYGQIADDDFPGRYFSHWPMRLLRAVLEGAGFSVESIARRDRTLFVTAQRSGTLPDTVGEGMRMLVCGLNPSLYAAEVGVGFASAGNRFWPAALAAGLISSDRDPGRALREHGVGMTDLVKRPSQRAEEIDASEFKQGLERLEVLAGWLKPAVVCFVGLAGWRAAVDRRAKAGAQHRRIGGRPVYLMPSTSGLNARCPLEELTDHLHSARGLAEG